MTRIRDCWKEKWMDWLLFAVLLIQLGIWMWLNLFHVEHAMDDDLAKLMTHVVEMWKNRTLFIEDWAYFTMGEADCAAFFGLVFYTFTKDICLSFGLANLTNMLIFGATIWILFSDLEISKTYRYVALLILFVPYMFGQLYYSNMLFYAGAQYIYKVLLSVMLVMILYHPREKRKQPLFIALVVCYVLFVGIVALQSGIYVLAVGFLPVFVFQLTKWLAWSKEERRVDIFGLLVCAGTILLTLFGTMIAVRNGLDAKGNTMNLLQSGRVVEGLHNLLYQFLLVLNLLPDRATSAVSVSGLNYVWKILIFVGILYFGCRHSGSFLHLRELFDGEAVKRERLREVKEVLFSIFIWNTAILLLTQCTVRYLLVGFIPLMIAAVLELSIGLSDNAHVLFKNIFLAVLAVAVLWMSGYSVTYAKQYYFIHNEDIPKLSAYFREEQYQNVFFCDDSGTVEKLRQLDDGIVYVVYYPDEKQTFVIDYYRAAAERSCYTDRNALVIPDDIDGSRIPEYISSLYQEKARIGKYVIYEAKQNRFDGETGLEFGSFAIDYPYVDGYEYQGEINHDGILLTYGVEDYALISPVYRNEREKHYTITLNYQAAIYEGRIGKVELWCGGQLIDEEELSGEQNSIIFDVNRLHNCQMKVKVDSDKSIAIQNIVFEEVCE